MVTCCRNHRQVAGSVESMRTRRVVVSPTLMPSRARSSANDDEVKNFSTDRRVSGLSGRQSAVSATNAPPRIEPTSARRIMAWSPNLIPTSWARPCSRPPAAACLALPRCVELAAVTCHFDSPTQESMAKRDFLAVTDLTRTEILILFNLAGQLIYVIYRGPRLAV